MDQQMKLDIDAKRPRVCLQEDTPKPRPRVLLIDQEALDKAFAQTFWHEPYSPWLTFVFNKPPESGFWDVRIRHTHGIVAEGRAKYHEKTQGWEMPEGWKWGIGGLEWRGLAYDPNGQ
jgi:hypothetical protein